MTYFNGESVQLFNRKLHKRTDHYPELHELSSYCHATSVILDAEVIAFGSDGKPSFHILMKRDGIKRMERVNSLIKQVPITEMIFDILYLNGEWLIDLPLTRRLEILQEVIIPKNNIQIVSSNLEGLPLFQVMQTHGMEGILAKRKSSPYLLNQKSSHWLKIKNYKDIFALIGGFTLRGETVNAVLLGLYDDEGQFWYIGHVGTGKMTQQDWRDITKMLKPHLIKNSPFINQTERESESQWVTPKYVVKVQFADWTEGKSLRQPSIQAFVDVSANECLLNQVEIRPRQ